MKEWLMAKTIEDTQKFYDEKYLKDEYFAFCCGDWTMAVNILEMLGGLMNEQKDLLEAVNILEMLGGLMNEQKDLLDAACGHGEFLSVIKNVRKFGFDISPKAVAL